MRRAISLALLALLTSFAHAQQRAVVVATCGTPPGTYAAGEVRPVLQNTSGEVCMTGAGGGGGAPADATYITQTANGTLSAEQALSALSTGLMKVTTTTGQITSVVPAAGIETWLTTPSSANLISAVTNETGTGALVFANTPTLVTPDIGAATGTSLTATGKIEAGSASTLGISTDVLLVRDAAQTLAQRNGANAQTFNLYNTYTDAANYERLQIEWVSNNARIAVGKAGTGGFRDLTLSSNNQLNLGGGINPGGTAQWRINSSGHFIAVTDNANDIGASGATRPRTGYFGTSLQVSTNGVWSAGSLRTEASTVMSWNGRTALQSPSDGNLQVSNNAGTAFGLLQLGGTTSSFPAIKRSSATIAFRLADDSADAAITSAGITASGKASLTKGESYGAGDAYTIATDAITITAPGFLRVDTEASAATDNLATINGGTAGDIIIIKQVANTRDVTIKDGTGNIVAPADCVLTVINDKAMLIFDPTNSVWAMIACSING